MALMPLLIAVGLLTATVIAAVLLDTSISTTFNVTAQTERVRFFASDASPSRWVLDDVQLVHDHADTAVAFSGYFQPAPGIEVLVERVARGPVYVHVQPWDTLNAAAPDRTSVGTFVSWEEKQGPVAGRSLEIFIGDLAARADSGTTFILPLTGIVESGREVGLEAGGSRAILRSGTVTMLGRSVFSERVFEAGSVGLRAGDQFRVDMQESPSLGFVLADDEPGLTAAYRSVAQQGLVVRPGGGEFLISVPWLDQLLNDPLFRAIFLIIGALVATTTLLSFIYDRLDARRERAAGSRAPAPGYATARAGATAPESALASAGTGVPDDAAAPAGSAASDRQASSVRTAVGVAIAFVLLSAHDAAAQQAVHVKAGEEGQGVLRARGNGCFVVLPAHVVENAAGSIAITGPGGLRSSAQLEIAYEVDLAVLRIDEGGEIDCARWPDAAALDVARGAQGGYLRIVEPSGTELQIPVDIRATTPDYLTIRPRDPADVIAQTMSGASLIVNQRPAGLLLRVCSADDAGACVAGDADVLTMSAIARQTDGFFVVRNLAAEQSQAAEAADFQVQMEESMRLSRLAIEHSMGRTAGPLLPKLKRHLVSLTLTPSQGHRTLYGAIDLSVAVEAAAPPLPETLGRCKLFSSTREVRSFTISPDTLGANSAVAWGDTGSTLPPGEYWIECVIDGKEFESAHVELATPLRPMGEFELEPGRHAAVRRVTIAFPRGDSVELVVSPAADRPRVVLGTPRRPDAPLSISFDVEQTSGSPSTGLEHVECNLGGTLSNTAATVQNLRPGRWRVSSTFPGRRWVASSQFAHCVRGDFTLFEFTLTLR